MLTKIIDNLHKTVKKNLKYEKDTIKFIIFFCFFNFIIISKTNNMKNI